MATIPSKKIVPGKKPVAKAGVPAKKPVAKKPAGNRPAKITFQAPSDFKPAFFEVEFATLADGLLNGASLKIQRVKGNWTNEDARRYDLATYDLATYTAVAARLGSITAPNVLKRLPPETSFGLVIRVNRRSADGTLSVIIKGIKQGAISSKSGKMRWKWFEDKKDITYRKIRKITNSLAGAFVEVQLPPSGRQKKAAADEE